MRPQFLISVLCLGTLSLAGCYIGDIGGGMNYHRDFHYSFLLEAGGRVSVESFNGSVEISGWDENTVEIDGSKSGPTSEAADALRVDTDHAPDRISVRVVRPAEWRGGLGARLSLKVPRGAVYERIVTTNGSIRAADGAGPAYLRTTNESIRVERLRGPVDAQTTNGSVNLNQVEGDAVLRTTNGRVQAVQLTGGVNATTSNGSIDLGLPGPLTKDVKAHTSNGGITLRLPATAAARVMARTTNASIHCDFELKVNGEPHRQRLDGAIGNGGPLIDLSTSNGPIRLEKM